MLIILLIPVILIALVIVMGIAKGTARHNAAELRRELKGTSPASTVPSTLNPSFFPSWIDHPVWSRKLQDEMMKAAISCGLTIDEALDVVCDEKNVRRVFTLTAKLDQTGLSIEGQIAKAAEFIKERVASRSAQEPKNGLLQYAQPNYARDLDKDIPF